PSRFQAPLLPHLEPFGARATLTLSSMFPCVLQEWSSVVHVAQISFFNDSQDRLPEELLSIWPSLVDIAECASRGGSRVSVVQASRHSYRSQRSGVDYYFLPFGRATPASPMSDD